jgi:hypothetical protein
VDLLHVFRFCANKFVRRAWMVLGLAFGLGFPLFAQDLNPGEQHGAPGLTCTVQAPGTLYPGDLVTLIAAAAGLDQETEKKKYIFKWDLLNSPYAAVSGSDDRATFGAPMTPGRYTVQARMSEKKHAKRYSECSVSFSVAAFEPPTIACSANPSTVRPGAAVTITASGISPSHRPLTYAYSASAGMIMGNGGAATLSTSGVASGGISVTCNVADDRGQTASATVFVSIVAASALAAPPNPMWPVPLPSGHQELTNWRLGGAGLATMGQVANKLEAALQAVGYVDRGYYSIPGGFALVTRVEQINPDGTTKPMPDRFSSVLSGPHTLADYLKELFTTQPGYYRILVFVVTDQTIPYTGEHVDQSVANGWLRSASSLPDGLASEVAKPTAKCTVMIYEFENSGASDTPATLMPNLSVSTEDHLRKSGVWAAMQFH